MRDDPICGAAFTLAPGNVAVCTRQPADHAGLDHHDPQHQVSWPVCEDYCPVTRQPGDPPDRHRCGLYRGDTAARYADA